MRNQRGFTIVELLIVIVVIAVLAAISIVAYNGIQARSRASEASYGLTQAKKKLELYKVDNGVYPTTGNLASAGVTDSDVSYQYTSSNGSTYCITGTAGNVSYKASDTTNPTAGGCAGHGQGGVNAISNLTLNPSVETNTTGWTLADASGSATVLARDTTQAQNGSASAKYTVSALTTAGVYPRLIIGGTTTSMPLGTYTGSAWFKGPTSSYIRLNIVSNSSTIASGTIVALSPSTWTLVTVTATTTVANTNFYLYGSPVGSGGASTNAVIGDYIVDSVMTTAGTSSYNYADGNSSNWVWNGTTNNSTSTGPPL